MREIIIVLSEDEHGELVNHILPDYICMLGFLTVQQADILTSGESADLIQKGRSAESMLEHFTNHFFEEG